MYFGYKHQQKVEKKIFLFQRKVERGGQKIQKNLIFYSKYKNPRCEAILVKLLVKRRPLVIVIPVKIDQQNTQNVRLWYGHTI